MTFQQRVPWHCACRRWPCRMPGGDERCRSVSVTSAFREGHRRLHDSRPSFQTRCSFHTPAVCRLPLRHCITHTCHGRSSPPHTESHSRRELSSAALIPPSTGPVQAGTRSGTLRLARTSCPGQTLPQAQISPLRSCRCPYPARYHASVATGTHSATVLPGAARGSASLTSHRMSLSSIWQWEDRRW
jgi:hypothetical protein